MKYTYMHKLDLLDLLVSLGLLLTKMDAGQLLYCSESRTAVRLK
jgi:hypothetical protein